MTAGHALQALLLGIPCAIAGWAIIILTAAALRLQGKPVEPPMEWVLPLYIGAVIGLLVR